MLARLYKDTVPVYSAETGFNMLFVFRLIIAVVLAAAGLIFGSAVVIKTILLALAAIVAAYDLVHDSIDSVAAHKFVTTSFVLSVSVFISFLIGFGADGTFAVLIYQIVRLVSAFVLEKANSAATGNYTEELPESVNLILACKDDIESAANGILKIAMVLAVLYAIILPIVTSLTVISAIHRALIMLMVTSPAVTVITIPVCVRATLSYANSLGVSVKSAELAQSFGEANTLVFDKSGVFTENSPKLLSAESDRFDNSTFMKIVAHTVYNSDQTFADAILTACDFDIAENLISNFSDIPGYGVKATIQNAEVIVAKRDFFNTIGIKVPSENTPGASTYYVTVTGRYIGKLAVKDSICTSADNLIPDFKANGAGECILLCEEGQDAAETFAAGYGFDRIISECDLQRKLQNIAEIFEENASGAYIYSKGIEQHSNAPIDIRLGKKSNFADIVVNPEDLANLPEVFRVCRRMRIFIAEAAIMVFVIKALLIALAAVGIGSMWFACFIDAAAGFAMILNSTRITSNSFEDNIGRKKMS